MKRFNCIVSGRIRLVMILGLSCALAGCVRRDDQPGPSTTAPSVTDSSTSAASSCGAPGCGTPTCGVSAAAPSCDASTAAPVADTSKPPAEPKKSKMGKLVAIELKLPAPAFRGTPKPSSEPNVEPPLGKPRPPFFAPEGTVNLARGKRVTASDPVPASGELDYVTDGDKEASDFGYLGLRSGTEWIQIDLEKPANVYAVLIWHNHAEARVYRDVIVQVGYDPDFIDAVTVFNNDYDNSSGMGIGPDMGYVETSEGKLISGRGAQGRYVRLYSRGSHMDDKNHYTEVEVLGRPME